MEIVAGYTKVPGWPRLRERYVSFWTKSLRAGGFIAQIQNPNPDRPAPEPWMLEASKAMTADAPRWSAERLAEIEG